MAKKIYLEDEELRVKKVFIKKEKIAKLPKNYKKRTLHKIYINSKKNTEVMIKIASSCYDVKSLKRHLNYISRKEQLELFDQDSNIYNNNNEAIENFLAYDEFEYDTSKNKKQIKETHNIIFSMKDHKNAPVEKIKEALTKTLKTKYPNNNFLVVMHKDTDNPHCHVVLKVKDNFGKRQHIRKKDLQDLRKLFALELNALKVEASATIKTKINLTPKEYKEKDKYMNYHEVVSFGEALYDFKEDNEPSFYVKMKDKNEKEFLLWGKDLKEVVDSNNVCIGDKCYFAVTDQLEVKVTAKKKLPNKQFEYYELTTYKNIWEVSIKDKNEKDLVPLKNKDKKKAIYKILNKNEYVASTEKLKNNIRLEDKINISNFKDLSFVKNKNIFDRD